LSFSFFSFQNLSTSFFIGDLLFMNLRQDKSSSGAFKRVTQLI
jgi:hypothetical protein